MSASSKASDRQLSGIDKLHCEGSSVVQNIIKADEISVRVHRVDGLHAKNCLSQLKVAVTMC
jgi:hypothetical protein